MTTSARAHAKHVGAVAGGWPRWLGRNPLEHRPHGHLLHRMVNADEMVRKYGIGTGLIWIFALLALFVINVLGGIFGLIELLRCNNFQEVRRACYVLLLNALPWIILGVLYWVYMSD